MEEFIDNLFSPEELIAFENVTPSTADIAALRKTGNVTVMTRKDNGMIIETISYVSFDEKVSFTKVQSYYEKDEKAETIQKLTELIQVAISREDYESAAKYNKEKLLILAGNTKY